MFLKPIEEAINTGIYGENIQKAKTIIKLLDGMTIASAKDLLAYISKYLERNTLNATWKNSIQD